MEKQKRGHCQMCGRLQAAEPRMAKHGYTVEHGWFQGVCAGAGYEPLELSRGELDGFVVNLRTWADEADDRALKLEQREVDPEGEWVSYSEMGRRKRKLKPYAELKEWEKTQCRASEVYSLRSKAKHFRQHAEMMLDLAEKVHGTELLEVSKPEAAPRIMRGEKRMAEGGRVLEAEYQERGRVTYWYANSEGRRFKSWMGTQAWRRLEMV